jgi:peptidoglycan/LPS O-acetylase OafA/YrhL
MHINEFLIGNVLGFVYFRLNKNQKNYDLPITVLVGVMLVVLSLKTVVSLHNGLMAVLFVPLILLLSLNNGKITTIFSNKHLILLGEASYSMYILQAPIKSCTKFVFDKLHIVNENLLFYIFLIILIAVSIICYYVIEIPARDWIKNLKTTFKIKKTKVNPVDDSVNF